MKRKGPPKAQSRPQKWDEVDFWDPAFSKFAKDFLRDEFLEQRFPTSWQLNPRRRR